jgi:PTS system mannose-specific IIC component
VSYLALGVLAGLAAIERKGFLQAMLSRPVALGPIVGLALGDVTAGLYVGVPLELLWLGAVNLGAALPVHEALGTAAATGATVLAARALGEAGGDPGLLLPAVAVLAAGLCLPLAPLGRRFDEMVERWNERLYERAERDLARGDAAAAVRVNVYGLALPFAIAAVLAPAGAAVAGALVTGVLGALPAARGPLALGWIAFSALACASGARAMRAPRAPAVYVAALVLGIAVAAATTFADGGR